MICSCYVLRWRVYPALSDVGKFVLWKNNKTQPAEE